MQFALAALTNVALGLDDDIFAWRMIWQAADVTRGLPACRPVLPPCWTVSRSASIDAAETSSRPSGSCAAVMSSFSERATHSARFSVSNIPNSLSFSSRNSAIIPIRMSGSRGREAPLIAMRRIYRTTLAFRHSFRLGPVIN
jgi:hypothetical protein